MGLIYGFPTETNEDFEQTISFIAKNKDKITNLSCNKFVLLKNSKIILDNLLDKLNISNVHEHAEFSTYLLYDAPTVSNYLVDKFFAENNLGVPSKKINW